MSNQKVVFQDFLQGLRSLGWGFFVNEQPSIFGYKGLDCFSRQVHVGFRSACNKIGVVFELILSELACMSSNVVELFREVFVDKQPSNIMPSMNKLPGWRVPQTKQDLFHLLTTKYLMVINFNSFSPYIILTPNINHSVYKQQNQFKIIIIISNYIKILNLYQINLSPMKISGKQIINRFELREDKSLNRLHSKPISRSLSKVKNNSIILNQSPIKRMKGNELKTIKQKIKKTKQNHKSEKKKKQPENKEKKKKTNFINLKELKPLNLQKQKQLFFQNEGDYNPFFLYPNISDLNDEQFKDMKKYGVPDQSYLPLALKILQKSKKVQMHKLLTESQPLTIQQTSKTFDQYLKKLEITDLLSYEFAQNTIAPTSVVHNNQESNSKVMIGLPIHYRKQTVEGVMNHEIGTHFLRKHNDRFQKWYKDRKKYNLQPFLQTQQGLAAINQIFSYFDYDKIPALLYRPALMYYCCYLASKFSFAKIFQKLEQFQPNPDIRWRHCVRVKRGIADTSKTQGMYKDQIYFLGAVEILKNRRKLNFNNLHCGKISMEDCLRLTQKGQINTKDKVKIPLFLNDIKYYLKCLDRIAQINFIE